MLGAAAIASECRFAQPRDLTVAVAARLWESIDEAVSSDGQASLVLAGGSTPVPIYNTLRELPLNWDTLRLCLSDERWVAVDDPDSNEGMLRRELLGPEAYERVISLARTSDDIEADAARVERDLAVMQRAWDTVILGMGTDGHTASLFPAAPGLEQALSSHRRCVPVRPAGTAHPRLTLTLPELLNSRRILLLLSGERKWQVYREALAGEDVSAMPVRAILHQSKTPVDVYWSAQ